MLLILNWINILRSALHSLIKFLKVDQMFLFIVIWEFHVRRQSWLLIWCRRTTGGSERRWTSSERRDQSCRQIRDSSDSCWSLRQRNSTWRCHQILTQKKNNEFFVWVFLISFSFWSFESLKFVDDECGKWKFVNEGSYEWNW